jgi:glycosyltransferase involved in cell wall biosynthesis
MNVSIIIPYHNEGRDFLLECINQIKSTIDIENYEIIVVDDFSDQPLLEIEGIKIIRHDENKGVGAAFDTGVKQAQGEYLFLIASDIRFVKNNWASLLLKEITTHQKSFICTICVALNKSKERGMEIEYRRNINFGSGATILMFHDKKTNSKKSSTFRSIIEAKWLPRLRESEKTDGSNQIPCILGAAYGVKKSWYEYVDGWAGHKHWGTLEPYISLKSWLFGGDCRIAPRVEIGHIFKESGTHGTPQASLIYNKMLTATLLFEDYERLINFIPQTGTFKMAERQYKANKTFIMKKRAEYLPKIIFPAEEYFNKFNIDYRKND